MKQMKRAFLCVVACWMVITFLPMTGWAFEPIPESYTPPHPKTYLPSLADLFEQKARYDDPRPYLTTFGPKQVLPPELYEKLSYDIDEMKDKWAEVVGFRSPDLVGKIAPEIKPGKYSYQDKDKHPGLKELMWPTIYDRFNPGGPPHAGNFPEFELVPTRQYHWSLPVAYASLENAGKTKLDDQGYPDWNSWEGGYPFPKPSGEFKAQQIMYNVERRYLGWGLNYYILGWIEGYTKDLKRDFEGKYDVTHIRLAGRVTMPPYGFFDERAKTRGEFKQFLFGFQGPRDVAGAVNASLQYLDVDTMNQDMMYIPSLRRVRKLSSTDTQDPVMGQDQIYDDREGWMQKLTPNRYPYKYEMLEERELLMQTPSWDGSEYISSEGLEFRNIKFERRPMYVIKLTQLDKNYVYSYRIFLIDKETFNYHHVENYDRKGRLYRTYTDPLGFFPELGTFAWAGATGTIRDYIDLHSGVSQTYQLPAFWNRDDVSLGALVKAGK